MPEPTQLAFGSPLFSLELNHWANFNFSKVEGVFFGWFFILPTIFLLKYRVKIGLSRNHGKLENNFYQEIVILFFGSIFLTCWLTGMNFDYRLVFLLPLALLQANKRMDRANLFWLLVYFGVIYSSFEIYRIQFVGDFLIYLPVTHLIIEIWTALYRYLKSQYLVLNRASGRD